MVPAILALLPLLAAGPPDAYGDPLPRGAVARLGSVRWRCPDPPEQLIWSPDGKLLAGTHGGIALTIWAYPAGVVVRRFELPELSSEDAGPLTADQVRWTPDGKHLLVYGGDNKLVRVDVPTGKTERVDTGGHNGVAVAISADGRRGLLEVRSREEEGDPRSELYAFALDHPAVLRRLWRRQVVSYVSRGPTAFDSRVAPGARLTADGRFVVAWSVQSFAQRCAIFDLETGASWVGEEDSLREASVSADGQTLVGVDQEGRLGRWALAGPTWTRPFPVAGPVARSAGERRGPWSFSPGGRSLVELGRREGGADGRAERSVAVVDAHSLRQLREWSYRPGDEIAVRRKGTAVLTRDGLGDTRETCAVAPDNRTVAVASSDSPVVRFFDLTSGAERWPVGGHAAAVTALRRVGAKLVSVSSDRVGRVWELPGRAGGSRGREAAVFDRWDDDDLPAEPASRDRVKVLYDPEQNCIEVRNSVTEAVVWERDAPALRDLSKADRPKTLPSAVDVHWGRVAFAVGDTVTVCEAVTGDALAEVRAPGCWPTAIEFDRDPGTLVVGYHDGQVLVWDLHTERPRRPPSDADLASLWADLAGPPAHAARARSVFLDHPGLTVRWLDGHLKPLPRPTEDDIVLWLARLAHPKYAVREEATGQLVRHFDAAGPEVTEMLTLTKSPEVEQRLRAVIDRQARFGGDAEVVRLLRAVAVLEHVCTAGARALLLRVACGGGVPAARAAEALARMKGRPVNQANGAVVETGGPGSPDRRAR